MAPTKPTRWASGLAPQAVARWSCERKQTRGVLRDLFRPGPALPRLEADPRGLALVVVEQLDLGLTYGYETGGFSRIPLRWNDASGTLTIGKREGSFPGMLEQRTFEVVRVGKTKRVGFSFEPKPDRTVRYDGTAVEVRLE